jgi:CxC2 like cysteine cluster associated with KDZ transposases
MTTGNKVWNGSFFAKSNLKDLGLRVQLGHGGACCSSPLPGASDFVVFDVSGVHQVAVDFCDCRSNGFVHKRNQLFRVGWFPATFDRPKTVFTLSVLKMFQELTLQGKTTLYDFYHCMLRITDPVKLDKISVHFFSILFLIFLLKLIHLSSTMNDIQNFIAYFEYGETSRL